MDLPFRLRPEFATRYFAAEVCVRIFLLLVFLKTELTDPFERQIRPEEAWVYSYPQMDSYVPGSALWFLVVSVPVATIGALFLINRDWIDLREAGLCSSLALLLTGIVTNCIKLAVGRPRPDFLSRCYPEGFQRVDLPCTGSAMLVSEGRKSFPSGHASLAACLAVFTCLYLSGKLGTFTERGRRQSHKLLVLFPLLVAALIAASRTCDYHHHWQDVVVGGALGVAIGWLCYRHFYPAVTEAGADRPHCVAGVDDTPLLPQHVPTSSAAAAAASESDVKWM
ncbi:phospholipid phosphatase 5-like [Amphibalanus amphitrite]|uniref:phospholipid phosphatase 5-like n=1 Tax=Amphibalanus amphitrite TaxID=1232801 RepID=UPI001C91ADA7|nr:phospholipid phosphatase 5-like [Amphibalanus amphitrite]